MPNDLLEEQKMLDRVLYEVLQHLLEDPEFSRLVDEACLKVTGVSSPRLRSTVKLAFQNKVGM